MSLGQIVIEAGIYTGTPTQWPHGSTYREYILLATQLGESVFDSFQAGVL